MPNPTACPTIVLAPSGDAIIYLNIGESRLPRGLSPSQPSAAMRVKCLQVFSFGECVPRLFQRASLEFFFVFF